MTRNNFLKFCTKYFFVCLCAFVGGPAIAADYTLIPYSMHYNTAEQQDEYIVYLVDHRNATITKCKTIYNITTNLLSAEKCSDVDKLPFKSTANGSSISTTVIFTRSASTGSTVLGADGLWRLDESSGKVEFCVFGYQTPKCVKLSSD